MEEDEDVRRARGAAIAPPVEMVAGLRAPPSDPDLTAEAEELLLPPGFALPEGMAHPRTQRQYDVLERTACFLAPLDGQMEVLLRTKQSANPWMAFLAPGHRLHALYRHIKTSAAEGTYTPRPRGDGSEDGAQQQQSGEEKGEEMSKGATGTTAVSGVESGGDADAGAVRAEQPAEKPVAGRSEALVRATATRALVSYDSDDDSDTEGGESGDEAKEAKEEVKEEETKEEVKEEMEGQIETAEAPQVTEASEENEEKEETGETEQRIESEETPIDVVEKREEDVSGLIETEDESKKVDKKTEAEEEAQDVKVESVVETAEEGTGAQDGEESARIENDVAVEEEHVGVQGLKVGSGVEAVEGEDEVVGDAAATDVSEAAAPPHVAHPTALHQEDATIDQHQNASASEVAEASGVPLEAAATVAAEPEAATEPNNKGDTSSASVVAHREPSQETAHESGLETGVVDERENVSPAAATAAGQGGTAAPVSSGGLAQQYGALPAWTAALPPGAVVIPPPDIKAIVDKIAQYVARNGRVSGAGIRRTGWIAPQV